ncbi:MAG: glycosyltransferase family 2 protein [Acidimicrobiales bacterium]
MITDCIIAARNESETVADVVRVCRQVSFVRDVIVVDDGSDDDTAALSERAGAKVIRRDGSVGSKAHAMAAGVKASDADLVLFVDADLLGITPDHLEQICRPTLDGRATMSLGTFDYRFWNWLVLRFPPTTGERIIPRWVFEAIPPERLDGYTIEIMINAVVTEARLKSNARTMKGVTHRTKRDKFGPVEGWRRSWKMFWNLVGLLRVVRARTYWFYLRDLTIEQPALPGPPA